MLLHFPKGNTDIILKLGEKQKGEKRIGAEILVIRLKNLLPNIFLNMQDNIMLELHWKQHALEYTGTKTPFSAEQTSE